jgi:3-hydroxyacyl-[acyl-carrier-protein] dehydratase
MLLNSLYTIKRIHREGNLNRISILIKLNPSQEIFKGHFPGNPVLPGVCIVQIMKEILMVQLDKKLMLSYANSIKYLSFINPGVNSLVNLDVELKDMGNENIFCNAFLYFESAVFCRFKGNFKVYKN